MGPIKGHYGRKWYTKTLFARQALLLFFFEMHVGLLCWVLILGHGALLSQAHNVSVLAQTVRLLPFLPDPPPEDYVGNPLLCLKEQRKHESIPYVLRLEPPTATPPRIALMGAAPVCTEKNQTDEPPCLLPQHTMGLHWVNRTHVSFVGGDVPFDTEGFVSKHGNEHTLRVVNLSDFSSLTVEVPTEGTKRQCLHHDMRFYSETQTFFIVTRNPVEGSKDVVDTVSEVDLDGNMVWSWQPTLSKDLLVCMKWRPKEQN